MNPVAAFVRAAVVGLDPADLGLLPIPLWLATHPPHAVSFARWHSLAQALGGAALLANHCRIPPRRKGSVTSGLRLRRRSRRSSEFAKERIFLKN
jgi:hypothetical protein